MQKLEKYTSEVVAKMKAENIRGCFVFMDDVTGRTSTLIVSITDEELVYSVSQLCHAALVQRAAGKKNEKL